MRKLRVIKRTEPDIILLSFSNVMPHGIKGDGYWVACGTPNTVEMMHRLLINVEGIKYSVDGYVPWGIIYRKLEE